jgi:hypothetical protein
MEKIGKRKGNKIGRFFSNGMFSKRWSYDLLSPRIVKNPPQSPFSKGGEGRIFMLHGDPLSHKGLTIL